ncbi:autotransporter outer membrane beta-barrel domain-containing protein [Yersinia enterocolitica]|uniref:autotransporter outer membrane beta-barrel domain-containing protein n=1 Tax=Yersinia enterocolitica TaxID=630 RepID=UPI000ABC8557|nr:autotransporter outer membrane beta-barrel domain-containing protein [Yersinia enterocolitica]
MSHHNTLNTRLLPLSILISSLVSGGVVAASTTAGTPNISNGNNTQITSYLSASNNVVFNKSPEDILLEAYFPEGQTITQQMQNTAEAKIVEMRSEHQQKLAQFRDTVSRLPSEKKKQADRELAAIENIYAQELLSVEAALAYAKDQSTDNKNKLLQAAKNEFVANLELKAPGQFTPEEAGSLFNLSLTKDQSTLSSVIQQKITAIELQQQADQDTLNKLQDYLNQDLITPEQKEKLVTQLADKKAKLDEQAVAKQALEAAEKVAKEANAAAIRLTAQSLILKSTANIAEKAKEKAKNNLNNLDIEKVTKITAVNQNWDADTPDLANKLQDLIDDQNTSTADRDKAEAAKEAIAKAAAAKKLVDDKTIAHTTAENRVLDTTDKLDTAKLQKLDANNALTIKTDAMDTAVKELAQFNKATDPAVDMPVFDKIIAQSEQQTVVANTEAIDTKVSGGTQNVENNGKIIGSIISENGTVNLAVGALAHNTVVNQGTINNIGGTDHNSVINDGGKLALAGADKDKIAKSHNAQINTGGTAEVRADSEIHGLTSTGGAVALKDGAKAFATTIDGGTFTIAKGANAQHTSLIDTHLELIEGATADVTKVGLRSEFVLKNGAKTKNTIVNEDGKFTLEDGSSATGTMVFNGTVTVNDKATINNTGLNTHEAVLDLKAGAKATNTWLTEATLNLIASATADDTKLAEHSTFTLLNGATTTGTLIDSYSQFIVKDNATANATTLNSGEFIVDGTANNTTVAGGKFAVNKGATANNTTVAGGKFAVNKGATANTTILSKGDFIVDGIAKDTMVTGGKFAVNKGAAANTTILSKGDFIVDGTANNTTVTGGKFTLNKDATANITTLNDGKFIVNGTANNTTVTGGKFTLNKGATADTTTLNSGEFIVDGTANNTTVKGGKFNLMARAQAHKLMVENGSALIAGHLVDAAFNGGTVIFDKTANIDGIINANKDSIINLHEGVKTAKADLILAGKMELIAADIAQTTAKSAGRAAFAGSTGKPAQFAFKNVELAGGSIDMSKSNAQLTMASLAGKGNFKLGSALYNHATAPLNVTGDANGEFDIQIDASGVAPTNLSIVDVKGANTARFALSNGPINLGNYQHNLVSDGKGGFKLVADKTALTPGVAGILAVANTTPTIFNAELSSIQNRLDKQSASANESGVWLTYLNDSYDVKGTATDFNQKLSGVTLGGDKAIELGNAVLSLGGFASHTSSNIKSDYQSSGSVESNSLGAYAQLLSNSGYYFNSVLKTNQFKQNLNIDAKGSNASGNANFSGLGLAVKAGKHITIDELYVSPFAAMSSFTSGKSQYQLSNGMEAQSQGARTTTGTIGMNTGYRFVLNSGAEIKPYAIFSVDHDLMAKNDVMINNELFDNSLKGTRANAGVGVNVNLTSNLSVGSEVKVSKGKNIATPMTINMGVAYTF